MYVCLNMYVWYMVVCFLRFSGNGNESKKYEINISNVIKKHTNMTIQTNFQTYLEICT